MQFQIRKIKFKCNETWPNSKFDKPISGLDYNDLFLDFI